MWYVVLQNWKIRRSGTETAGWAFCRVGGDEKVGATTIAASSGAWIEEQVLVLSNPFNLAVVIFAIKESSYFFSLLPFWWLASWVAVTAEGQVGCSSL